MGEVVLTIVLVTVLAGACWLLRDLRPVPAVSGRRHRSASVSVVIPARDEAATLPALLESLRRLTIGPQQVIVVDDGSRDQTASVARAGGAVVIPAGAPPPGWTGKAWACHVGTRATTGDLLLFVDADTRFAPDALAGLLALWARQGGLVSVQPFHQAVRPYEQLSTYFNLVSLLASGAFAARPPQRPMAFGPCLLTSRAHYERAGGHGAVRGEILDDVALAAAYQRAGLPVRCAIGGRSIQMRSYPGGIRQMAAGWTKNIASGASAAAPEFFLPTVLWVGAHHAVAVGAALALAGPWTGPGLSVTHPHSAVWAIGWLLTAAQLRSILHRIGSFRWWTWALFPLPLLAFDVLFALSAAQTVLRRSVRWRGREVGLPRRGSARRGI